MHLVFYSFQVSMSLSGAWMFVLLFWRLGDAQRVRGMRNATYAAPEQQHEEITRDLRNLVFK